MKCQDLFFFVVFFCFFVVVFFSEINKLSSAAVVIGALRFKRKMGNFTQNSYHQMI